MRIRSFWQRMAAAVMMVMFPAFPVFAQTSGGSGWCNTYTDSNGVRHAEWHDSAGWDSDVTFVPDNYGGQAAQVAVYDASWGFYSDRYQSGTYVHVFVAESGSEWEEAGAAGDAHSNRADLHFQNGNMAYSCL